MAISDKIEYASPNSLYLDAKNPRLEHSLIKRGLSQKELLSEMRDWELEELAVSFVESGFWTQEPLVVVKEKIGGELRDVVVEGNRRLAALKLLFRAVNGEEKSEAWKKIAKSATSGKLKRIEKVPFVRADSRADVQSYLGFRHVSGIKQWEPAEKAQFIAHMIDDLGYTYEQVQKRIGSKTPTVRQNYISYRLLLQLEDIEDVDIERVRERFSVLYLSLRTEGVRKYLNINLQADPKSARSPILRSKLQEVARYALWLFGNKDKEPLLKDSRDTDRFGAVLLSNKAVEYLEHTPDPSFETAERIAGGDEVITAQHVERASEELEHALGTAHHHVKSLRLQTAVRRVSKDADRLLMLFPKILAEFRGKPE